MPSACLPAHHQLRSGLLVSLLSGFLLLFMAVIGVPAALAQTAGGGEPAPGSPAGRIGTLPADADPIIAKGQALLATAPPALPDGQAPGQPSGSDGGDGGTGVGAPLSPLDLPPRGGPV